MIYAITYTDDNYKRSALFNRFTAKIFGHANKARIFRPEDLDKDFCEKNKELLSFKRGGGYWVWKPYIMKKALEEVNDGDYVMFSDAGLYYVRSIKNLIRNAEKLNEPVFLSSTLLPNRHWCKRDAMIVTGCDEPSFYNTHQIESGYILIKKCKKSVEFIDMWLELACNPLINSDYPNKLGKENYPGFRENRHDQTALNIVAYKYGVRGHRGFSDSSEYILYQYRKELFGCWDYTIDELKKFAYEEYTSQGFLESDYKRIMVNCRARDQRILHFIYIFLLETKGAIKVDLNRKKSINEILNLFNKENNKQ